MKGTRREFLGQSAMLIASGIVGTTALDKVAAAAGKGATSRPASQPSGVTRRPLGGTGLNVSVISVGSIGTTESIIRYAMSRGVNFIHTCIGYNGGKSIREVGKALKGVSKDKVYTGLKVTWNWDSDDDLNKSLKLINRDCTDVIFFQIHNGKEVTDTADKAKETFARWKKQGKVRFMGLTSHGDVENCMTAALDAGGYEVLMPGYDLSKREAFQRIFDRCEKQKVGIVAMKTHLSEDKAEQIIPVMLKDKAVTTICKSLTTLSAVKKYIEASEKQVASQDADRILQLAQVMAAGRCTMCAACTRACPNGLAVNDLVRSVNYYVDSMRDFEAGKENFQGIDANRSAGRCQNCGQCEKACPNRVPVRHFIRRAGEIFV